MLRLSSAGGLVAQRNVDKDAIEQQPADEHSSIDGDPAVGVGVLLQSQRVLQRGHWVADGVVRRILHIHL